MPIGGRINDVTVLGAGRMGSALATVRPGVHFPGVFGCAAAQLHHDLAAEGGFNFRLRQQLSG
jgi:hypothetical protein